METYSRVIDKNGRPVEYPDQATQESCSSCTGMEKAKLKLAEKLDNIAATLKEKAAGSSEQSDLASYGRDASDILHQSAAYVRDFDYDQAEAEVRGHIRQQPGRSLMIAGGVGLLLGFLLRRR